LSRWLRRAGLGAACLLTACDLAPTYHPPEVQAKTLPIVYKEGGPWQPATPADALPRGKWWRMYHVPLLDQLETQLLAANPDLASAVATYDSYRDQALQLNANLFPFVTAGASTTRTAAGALQRQHHRRKYLLRSRSLGSAS
jgi:outer membrane protein TolC